MLRTRGTDRAVTWSCIQARDWSSAYEATADAANDHYRDKYADLVDAAKQRAKDAGNWPLKPSETIIRLRLF